VRDEIDRIAPGSIETTERPERIVERVVHFGSQYMWLTWGAHMSHQSLCDVVLSRQARGWA
jgi:hypothetical protein